jgi:hypothetical protein
MLPPFFATLPAEINAAATVSPTLTAIHTVSGTSHYTMVLAVADGSAWVRIRRPRTAFVFDVSGRYGRSLVATGTTTPPTDIAARGRSRLDFASSPRTNFQFLTNGFVSSRIGLRASDDLAVRDPFSVNRVLYGWNTQSSLSVRMAPRASLRFDIRYAQLGAVAADVPSAVGIDTHAADATATGNFQWSPRFSIGPVIRMDWTFFNHALLDVNLNRGPAEVKSLSTLGFARWALGPRTSASIMAGLTLASAPPSAYDKATIALPNARIELRSMWQRVGGTAAFSFGYQSLGPRIGFGMDYAGLVDAWARPFRGAARRDVLVNIVGRIRWANAQLPVTSTLDDGSITDSRLGRVSTAAFVFGSSVSAPIRLGWSLRTGVDVEFVSMNIDPLPVRGDPPQMFRALLTLGLVASASTDPVRLLPRDPLAPPTDERVVTPHRAVRRIDSTGVTRQDVDDEQADEIDD